MKQDCPVILRGFLRTHQKYKHQDQFPEGEVQSTNEVICLHSNGHDACILT